MTIKPITLPERVLYAIFDVGLLYVDKRQVATVLAYDPGKLTEDLRRDGVSFTKLLDAARLAKCVEKLNSESLDLEQLIMDSIHYADPIIRGYKVIELSPICRPTADQMCDACGYLDSPSFMAFFKRMFHTTWSDFWSELGFKYRKVGS